jgi:hypothetical protein
LGAAPLHPPPPGAARPAGSRPLSVSPVGAPNSSQRTWQAASSQQLPSGSMSETSAGSSQCHTFQPSVDTARSARQHAPAAATGTGSPWPLGRCSVGRAAGKWLLGGAAARHSRPPASRVRNLEREATLVISAGEMEGVPWSGRSGNESHHAASGCRQAGKLAAANPWGCGPRGAGACW